MRIRVQKLLLLIVTTLLATATMASTSDALVIEAPVPGAILHITIAQPIDDHKARQFVTWLQAVAGSVSSVYGRFPNPSPRVLVIPTGQRTWGGDSAVPFGRVTRQGEESIELYVDANRPIEEFYANWTATHEFSHLLLPYLDEQHRWISEGFASYYQNVLMSRAGHYSPTEAWQYLYEGLERGRASRPDLTPNEAAAAGIRQARMKIYWSGTAIALLADINIRERSGNAESLDRVLGRLQQCCLPSKRTWSGSELFAKLDSLLDEPVFMPLYRQHAQTAGFPDVKAALQRLGVDIDDNQVQLRADAELADVRRAITEGTSL